MLETVRYTYRLRPGAQASAALEAEWHRCRFLWNEAVHQQQSGMKPNFGKLCRLLTELRRVNEWMRDGSQVAQQQMLRTYSQALNRSFSTRGHGRPSAKSRRRSLPSLGYSNRGFSIDNGRLLLPKGVSIPVVWSRALPSKPSSVQVTRDSIGNWYASFVVSRETSAPTETNGCIGIDWGVAVTATTSDSRFDLPYLGHRRRSAAELAKAQRKMSRRRRERGAPASGGYVRARREAAKLHKKAARQTQHDSRVWAKAVVDNHQTIAVEDFKPKFLAKSSMARKSADAAIGCAKQELIDRATRAGRTVVMVKPAYTTMTCSSCFARAKQRLGLAVRTFLCHECGHTDSRDRNAARVILAVAERGHISVDDVRHLQPSLGSVVGAV